MFAEPKEGNSPATHFTPNAEGGLGEEAIKKPRHTSGAEDQHDEVKPQNETNYQTKEYRKEELPKGRG